MYRTKELAKLKEFLNPILDLAELYISEEGFIKRIGSDTTESEEFIYIFNNSTGRKLMFIENEYQFHQYKENRDTCEYFNPLIKYKNTIHILMMIIPIIYSRFCKVIDVDNEEDLVYGITEDLDYIDQEEINKYISILQYPKNKENNTFKFECVLRNNKDKTKIISYENENKILVVLVILLKMVMLLDNTPKIIKKLDLSNDDELYDYLEECLLLYSKERELNSKDMLKSSKEAKDIENIDMDLSSTPFEEVDDTIVDNNIVEGLEEDDDKIDILKSVSELFNNEYNSYSNSDSFDNEFGDLDFS